MIGFFLQLLRATNRVFQQFGIKNQGHPLPQLELILMMKILVDVDSVVLGGQHDRAVVHQSHVEALRVFDLNKGIFKIKSLHAAIYYSDQIFTLDSRALMRLPSAEKTDRLKLLWLSQMVMLPDLLRPTPMGKLVMPSPPTCLKYSPL